jgi:predicted thioesterase
MIEPGISIEQKRQVLDADSIKFLGEAVLPSLSTPSMIQWMEIACRDLVQPHLESGQDTVGVAVNIEHLAAAPLGAQVLYRSSVSALEGRRVSFAVEALDGPEIIGKGTHDRFIIDIERFAQRLRKKFEDR